MSGHALLSASAASRWLNCTASARIEEDLPDSTSQHAAEGTLAHSVAELKARRKFHNLAARTYNSELKKLKAHELWQPEMDAHTDAYVNYLTELAHEYKLTPHVALETRVDYSHVAPEGFGTADCIMIGGDTLHVCDFKYGKGVPVSADNNPQMMLYALGALNIYAPIYGGAIKNIRMTIIQPRLDSISSFEITREALEDWGERVVRPLAQLAYGGEGELKEGEWCRFCRARSTCRARADANTVLEDFKFVLPPLLTDVEVGELLHRATRLKAWVSDIEGYALKSALSGKAIPGWKLVEGTSRRSFTDETAAINAIIGAGISKDTIYEPKTLAQIEKLVGKKEFEQIAGSYVIKPPGKPTLVQENDPRPVYSSAAADFAGLQIKGDDENV